MNKEDRQLCDDVGVSAQMLFEKGRKLAHEGNVEDAIMEFRKGIKIDSSLGIKTEKDAQKIVSLILFDK